MLSLRKMSSKFILILIFISVKYLESAILGDYEECGVEPGEGLVFGGNASRRFEAPWKAAIYRNDLNKERIFEYKCGGVVITKDSVVTGEN